MFPKFGYSECSPTTRVIPTAEINESHFKSLTTYRSYLIQEMNSLQSEFRNDEIEMKVVEKKVREGILNMAEAIGICKTELHNAQLVLEKLNCERQELETENLEFVAKLKDSFEEQKNLETMKKKISKSQTDLKTEREKMKGDCLIFKENKEKCITISQLTSEIQKKSKELQFIKAEARKAEKKDIINTAKTEEIYKSIQELTIKKTVFLNEARKVEDERKLAAKKQAALIEKLDEERKKNSMLCKNLESSESLKMTLEFQLCQLSQQLNEHLEFQESEERAREKDYESLAQQAQEKQTKLLQLAELKDYLKQLKEGNEKLSAIAQEEKKKRGWEKINKHENIKEEKNEVRESRSLLSKTKSVNILESYLLPEAKPQSNPIMVSNTRQTPAETPFISSLSKSPSTPSIQFNSPSFYVKPPTLFIEEPKAVAHSSVDVEPISNYVSSMPKEVTDIIRKYRTKENSQPSHFIKALCSPREGTKKGETNNEDKDALRLAILEELANYRPTASYWLNKENRKQI